MSKALVTTLALLALVTLTPAAQEKQVLMPEDNILQWRVGAPAVSPDGEWIAYSVSHYCPKAEATISDIYLLPFAGGEPKQLTAGEGAESGYTWSPCSRYIAFSARRLGDEAAQIYVINIEGGEARRVTSIESGARNPLFSPDGSWIAFYSRVGSLYDEETAEILGDARMYNRLRYYHLGPGWDDGSRQRLFAVPTAGGAHRQLTDGECADEGDHSMVWRPDSQEIAFVSGRSPEWWNSIDTNVFAVNVETGQSRQLTANPGPDHSPAYSPDGQWLAWRSSYEYNYESENYKIHVMPAAGGEGRALTTALDRNVRSLNWGPDSTRIFFTASSEGNRNIQYVDIGSPDTFGDVTAGCNSVYAWSVVGPDSFAMTRGSDVEGAEIWTLVGGQWSKLTDYTANFWGKYEVMPCEELWIEAEDGTRLQGWLIKPVGYVEGQRYPLILQIHGGPHGMYGPGLNFRYQLYAHHGYAVLFTNPRGSDGYGQAFADVIHYDWGTKPFADLMAFVDKAVEMGVADPQKLGVTGGSYGGYMTNWIIGHTDRFAAAICSAGLSNMVSFFGSTDEQFFAEKEMGGVPWRNKEVYLQNSPLWYADNFKTPMMVFHGDIDWRVRTEQGEQIFAALQKVGVPSVYVNFPREQHGVRQSAHVTLQYKLILDWFGHWLKGEEIRIAKYIQPRAYVHPPAPAEQ